MSHPFTELLPEYHALLSTVMIRSLDATIREAEKFVANAQRYAGAISGLNLPLPLLMAIHDREASGSFKGNLANGDPLTGPTIHVPKGRPPLQAGVAFPVSWEYAARDAIAYDHLDSFDTAWSLAYACYKAEGYNGFGPRAHGIHSGYLWAGTNHYTRGKYVADGVWRGDVVDEQLGAVPLMLAIGALRPDLRFGSDVEWEGIGSISAPAPVPPPAAVGGSLASVQLVQVALNELHVAGTPLLVDGSFGKRTRDAVRAFQLANGITPVDGLLGPITIPAISAAASKVKPAST